MIERLADSLKRASSRAKEFMTAVEAEKPKLFVDFISNLKIAAGSCHQLGLYQENTNFLKMRDNLEKVIEVGQSLPTFTGNQSGLWFSIKTSLDNMAEQGKRMATSKGMKRSDVLVELALREKAARPETRELKDDN